MGLVRIKPKVKVVERSSKVSVLPKWERKEEPMIEWTVNNIIGREILESCKKGEMSIDDLMEIADAQQELCYDDKQNIRDITFNADRKQGLFYLSNKSIGDSFLTPYALTQLGNRYGIPAQYVRKCMKHNNGMKENNPFVELVEENYRTWLHEDNSVVFLRQYDNEGTPVTRAVLSERYVPFDTPEIVSSIRDIDELRKNWSVRQYLVNPERFHLRFVGDEPLNVGGEDLFMGFTIDSSDVGRSSLNIRFIIFKQVCTNGLILPKFQDLALRQIHMGAGAQRFGDNVAACLSAVSNAREYAEMLVSNVSGKKLPFKMDDEEKIESFRSNRGISKEAMTEILEMVKAERYGEPSRWALINAMTEVAQNFGIETRLNIEKQAGLLLAA